MTSFSHDANVTWRHGDTMPVSVSSWCCCVERKELLDELSSMPIRNDTRRIRTKRDDVEQQLNKVDEAIKIFSRNKVFVKLDLWLNVFYAVAWAMLSAAVDC